MTGTAKCLAQCGLVRLDSRFAAICVFAAESRNHCSAHSLTRSVQGFSSTIATRTRRTLCMPMSHPARSAPTGKKRVSTLTGEFVGSIRLVDHDDDVVACFPLLR